MQYWINQNGVQSGPVGLEDLKQMGLTSAAYVWHEGLSDWVKITQVPELKGMYAEAGGTVVGESTVATGPQEPVTADATVPPIPDQGVEVEDQTYYPQNQYQPQYAGNELAPVEPCPPTNLVWAIITTVLCCIPAGIVAIVYALKVQNKYRAGDIEGAKRASETGAWWCIAAIILGIICQPFISWLQVLALGQ